MVGQLLPTSTDEQPEVEYAPVRGCLPQHLNAQLCQRARQSRDARFDGQFVVAVKTTGIFCRPICPVVMPKEENVEYFGHGAQAMQAGYRPCLRCRPDSAPDSWAWRGTETTFVRALTLIEDGALQQGSLMDLCDRLGVSDRYLRKLFQQHLGTSPKQYDGYKRLMFAKQLLHQSSLSITDVAHAAGFNSVRRFNDALQKQLQLTPTQVRRQKRHPDQNITLSLAFRPPYDWQRWLAFYRAREIQGIEKVTDTSYYRRFQLKGSKGWFRAQMNEAQNCIDVSVTIDDVTQLQSLVKNLRRFFDLDADLLVVEKHLQRVFPSIHSGVRLPGIFNLFEAGIRAILGQQISVMAARKLVQQCVDELGEVASTQSVMVDAPHSEYSHAVDRYFPSPQAFIDSDLQFLKIPDRRRQSLKALAKCYQQDCRLGNEPNVQDWLDIVGIGPWTVDYVRMRGLSEPDVFLQSDLAVKQALQKLGLNDRAFDPMALSPWGSYATLQLWMMDK